MLVAVTKATVAELYTLEQAGSTTSPLEAEPGVMTSLDDSQEGSRSTATIDHTNSRSSQGCASKDEDVEYSSQVAVTSTVLHGAPTSRHSGRVSANRSSNSTARQLRKLQVPADTHCLIVSRTVFASGSSLSTPA